MKSCAERWAASNFWEHKVRIPKLRDAAFCDVVDLRAWRRNLALPEPRCFPTPPSWCGWRWRIDADVNQAAPRRKRAGAIRPRADERTNFNPGRESIDSRTAPTQGCGNPTGTGSENWAWELDVSLRTKSISDAVVIAEVLWPRGHICVLAFWYTA